METFESWVSGEWALQCLGGLAAGYKSWAFTATPWDLWLSTCGDFYRRQYLILQENKWQYYGGAKTLDDLVKVRAQCHICLDCAHISPIVQAYIQDGANLSEHLGSNREDIILGLPLSTPKVKAKHSRLNDAIGAMKTALA